MNEELLAELLSGLNPQQAQAAAHGTDPLLIVAGAGTGKTTTLAHRVAHLIATGTDPSRILLLTFTRRAAAEMLRRVESLLRRLDDLAADAGLGRLKASGRSVWGGTFHAIATRLLRKYGRSIGVPRDFGIMDQGDSQDLMQVVRTAEGLAEADKRFPAKGSCLAIYSRCVNTQRPLVEILAEDYAWCIDYEQELRTLFDKYMDRKEQLGVLDYDDLLLFWGAMLDQPETAEAIRSHFDAVLVDEYQDTNLLQADVLRKMTSAGKGMTVVGDDAQSIYAFRGATVRNILDFPQQFPSATVVKLEQNYRSTPSILDVTNGVIADAKEGHRKTLWSDRSDLERPSVVECQDEDEEAEWVIDEILAASEAGQPLKQQAVLFRASHHCMILEAELTRRKIPFQKFGGLKFMETAHVKDLLAFLRLAENPRDIVSGQRVLTLLPGVGQKTAQKLLRMTESTPTPFDPWAEWTPPAKSRETWPAFVTLMRDLLIRGSGATHLTEQVRQAVSFYKPLLEQKFDHSSSRMKDLEQLEQVASRFEDRPTFLTEITLDPPTSTRDLSAQRPDDEDYVVLSTIHSAKGLEWETVFVLQACDGSIPSQRALGSDEDLEEERRLFYVACTRAKNRLLVMHPCRVYTQNRYRGDNYGFAHLTRFLNRETRGKMQNVFPGDMVEDGEAETAEQTTTEEIRNRLRSRF